MLKQLITNHAKHFIKYTSVGVSAVLADTISLVFLKEVVGISPTFAIIINQLFLIIYVFSLNKYWTFRNTEMPHKQFVRFCILAGWNYFFSVASMYIFNEKIGIHYLIVRFSAIILAVSWNFLLYKFWVYKQEIE
jgi:putative flippase GtrA